MITVIEWILEAEEEFDLKQVPWFLVSAKTPHRHVYL